MSLIIQKYINFALNSIFFLTTILLFAFRSNYFFQNYLIIFCIAVVFFIFLSGVIKTKSLKFICGGLNFIDFLFVFDFLFNFAAIAYSHQPRASIEDLIYQCCFIFIYLIVRAAAIIDRNSTDKIFAVTYIQIILFVSKILHTVLYKFQFISVDGRVSYNSMHPNLLASYMLIGLSIIVYYMFKNFNNKTLLFHGSIFLTVGFALIMTSSRGGMLGLFLGLLAVFLVSNIKPAKKFGYLAVLSAAALAGIYFVFPIHFQRIAGLFSSENYMTLGSRLHIWTFALKQFALNPLLGIGPAACNFDIQQFSNSSMVDAHNFLLEKLCNVGIIGTLIYLAPLALLTREKLKRGAGGPVKFFTAFLIAGLFTNSSFSPHYALPVLSINLYLILALINSLITEGAEVLPRKNFQLKSVFIDIIIIAILTCISSSILKIVFLIFNADIYNEAFLWLLPVSFLISSFIYDFFVREVVFRSDKNQRPDENAYNEGAECAESVKSSGGAEKLKYHIKLIYSSLTLLSLISMFLLCRGFYYFAAEKANGIGIDRAMNFSAGSSKKHFDIAIENDPQNIAYLLNKSFILFIDEFFRSARLEGNINIGQSSELMKKSISIFPHDQLLKSNLLLLTNKFNAVSSFESHGFKTDPLASATANTEEIDIDTQIIMQNTQTSFAKFADVFGEVAYKRWTAANAILKSEALAIMNREKVIKPGTKLAKFFDFISITLETATNMDLPNIDVFLITGVNAAFKATEAADKFLPVKGFKEYSLQNTQQEEILSTVAMVLPVIWKYIEKNDAPALEARFQKMFGSAILFPIINHFLFGDPAAANYFEQYTPRLKGFLQPLKLFSEKDFEGALNIQLQSMKAGGDVNSILLSWIYYKLKKFDEAREVVLYSQFRTLAPFRRDFTYKRDLLFGGNIMHFYYLPLQAYYNEFIMLALIKMHNGDHSMVLREIFDYLNTVLYGGRGGRN